MFTILSDKMVHSRKGLQPLEFEECIVDSPEFRENLTRHEKELDHTSQQIKKIIKEIGDLVGAAKNLSLRQRTLAVSLKDFNFECIGSAQTDDEQIISESLRHFGKLMENIEEEREKMLRLAHDEIIEQLEDFRKKQIGGVKENKKKFDKKTEKFCQSQEKFLNMSTKKPILEADVGLEMHEREYINESLSYVLRIQEVQERIKFEFVEILLAFISGWLVFYHTAHDQGENDHEYLTDLRHKVQKTRENFEETREKVNELKSKYMEKKKKSEEKFTKRGYLFLMEKKPFKATWSKYFCTYKKQQKQFTMLQFNQTSGRVESPIENFTLLTCTRRTSEFEKRFCFDLSFKEKPGITYTFQALSEKDQKAWIDAMDGTEPTYFTPGKSKSLEDYHLDEMGFAFVKRCIEVLESRGLEDEGLYRKSGVGTKISRLLNLCIDKKKVDVVFTDEQYRDLMESNTIASALKTYLRNLNEPLMTYQHHCAFISAAKQDTRRRVSDIHSLVHQLPKANFEMLDIVIRHLTEVSKKFEKNKMSVFNLGVVFGPTLLRPVEETVAAILDIKFNNIVISILIDNYELIFKNLPSSIPDTDSTYLPPTRAPPPVHPNSKIKNDRPGIYSPQKIQRVVANYTDQPISSSLQNIPNDMLYQSHSGSTSSSAVISTDPDNPNIRIKMKNHYMSYMTSSENDISTRRELVNNSFPSSNNTSSTAYQYIKLPNPTKIRNYTTVAERSTDHNAIANNLSPPTSIRNDPSSLYEQSHPKLKLYANKKSYVSSENNDRMYSTSSSNESICDSTSSNREGGKHNAINVGSTGWVTVCSQSSDYGSTANILNSLTDNCDDTLSRIRHSTDIVPKKMHRTKDVNQMKNDLVTRSARVRTLYACLGENEGELSFEPNQIITNVRLSHEPGWLQGTLNGKTGLIPENYVEPF